MPNDSGPEFCSPSPEGAAFLDRFEIENFKRSLIGLPPWSATQQGQLSL